MHLDFVQNMLKNGVYAQCLLQADKVNSEAKGTPSVLRQSSCYLPTHACASPSLVIPCLLCLIGSTLASAFKRVSEGLQQYYYQLKSVTYTNEQVLLSRDEYLQLSGAQCIAKVLTHNSDYGRVLLKSDIAGTLMMTWCELVYIYMYVRQSLLIFYYISRVHV